MRFFLGIANSKLVSWYGGIVMPNFGKEIFPKLNPQDIAGIPVVSIDLENESENEGYCNLVHLVERMLSLFKSQHSTPIEQEQLQRQIAATDAEIDRLVYELYDLTEEEIKIVEGSI